MGAGGSAPIAVCGAPVELGGVVPLYTEGDAENAPITTQLADGTLVTRAAGRVRNRHEKESTFGTYGPSYYEDRSFGVLIEDFTPTGEQRIVITYLPLLAPMPEGNRITNVRAWKEAGESASFMVNAYMTDVAAPPQLVSGPFGGAQQYEVVGAPAPRTMAAGQTLELEFGIYLPSSVLTTPGTRDTYYSDTFRYVIGQGGLTPNNTDYPSGLGPLPNAQLGGGATIAWLFQEPHEYYDQMALDMQLDNAQTFLEGRRIFYTDFSTGESAEEGIAPFAQHAQKAGPLMNTTSCANCHVRGGAAAAVPSLAEDPSSIVFKLTEGGALGPQLRPQGGNAYPGASLERTVTLGDGTQVVLTQPQFTVTAIKGDASRYSPRIAVPLIGVGLLEAIDELTLLEAADGPDCDQDGISGRAHFVQDPASGKLRVGRLGWKAEASSVAQQVALEAALSLGVGSDAFSEDGISELDPLEFTRLSTFVSLLGVPPQRTFEAPAVPRGEALFESVGCARCHLTQVVTSKHHPFSELRGQTIKPFTDLLLHDMGPELVDESGVALSDDPAAPAAASEWRTAPLWGIGLREVVNGHLSLLHDGRAASVLEAVLWHGGEAAPIVETFAALPTADREALLAYVMSL